MKSKESGAKNCIGNQKSKDFWHTNIKIEVLSDLLKNVPRRTNGHMNISVVLNHMLASVIIADWLLFYLSRAIRSSLCALCRD